VDIPAELQPLHDVSFILCGMVFCERCKAEVEYASVHAPFTDGSYLDHARAMMNAGWAVLPGDDLAVICSACRAGPKKAAASRSWRFLWTMIGRAVRGQGPIRPAFT
jgi:hypothetical protein